MSLKLWRVDFNNGEDYEDHRHDCVFIRAKDRSDAEYKVQRIFRNFQIELHKDENMKSDSLFNKWLGFITSSERYWYIKPDVISSVRASEIKEFTSMEDF